MEKIFTIKKKLLFNFIIQFSHWLLVQLLIRASENKLVGFFANRIFCDFFFAAVLYDIDIFHSIFFPSNDCCNAPPFVVVVVSVNVKRHSSMFNWLVCRDHPLSVISARNARTVASSGQLKNKIN